MNSQNYSNSEILEYANSTQQAELYEQLLQITTEVLKSENSEDKVQVRSDLQAMLRKKVAAHQLNTPKNDFNTSLHILYKPTIAWSNGGSISSMAAAVAAIFVCVLLGHFRHNALLPTVVAQDSLSMQQSDTVSKLDSQSIKQLHGDTIRQ